MKLIQLNAWGGRLEYSLLDFLKAEKPDILCLQEAIELPGDRGALFVTVENIKESIGTKHYYMSPIFTFNFMHRKASFGNCIISKYPFEDKKTIFTGREYIDDFDWTKHTQNIRNLQYVQINENGQNYHIFNHHGHHVHEHKDGDIESLRQCAIILDEVKKKKGKVILTGDFNLNPKAEALNDLNNYLINLSIKNNLKTTRTQLTYKAEVCDYIFVNREVNVESFKAEEKILSDHQALILNFS